MTWNYHTEISDPVQPVHVWPEADLVMHDLDDDGSCVCAPIAVAVARDDGSVGWMFRHTALDGRP